MNEILFFSSFSPINLSCVIFLLVHEQELKRGRRGNFPFLETMGILQMGVIGLMSILGIQAQWDLVAKRCRTQTKPSWFPSQGSVPPEWNDSFLLEPVLFSDEQTEVEQWVPSIGIWWAHLRMSRKYQVFCRDIFAWILWMVRFPLESNAFSSPFWKSETWK